MNDETEDTTTYRVVVNHEEQYSIWPANRENPVGWRDVDKQGTKEECLGYIKEVWTDMRPLSIRKRMEEAGRSRAGGRGPQKAGTKQRTTSAASDGNDLVKRLSEGNHPVEIRVATDKKMDDLKERIDRGYVLIRFTNTQGGTELGVRLDGKSLNFDEADFDAQTGSVHLVGTLTLDYARVQCVADIDLATLTGKGHLEPRKE